MVSASDIFNFLILNLDLDFNSFLKFLSFYVSSIVSKKTTKIKIVEYLSYLGKNNTKNKITTSNQNSSCKI